jgi:hypothetical protein
MSPPETSENTRLAIRQGRRVQDDEDPVASEVQELPPDEEEADDVQHVEVRDVVDVLVDDAQTLGGWHG